MNTALKSFAPTAAHKEALADLKAIMTKHSHLSGWELLALASQMVGNLIALQDQRTITPAMAMDLVAKNIELGNATVLEELMASGGSA